jgi:hypothetical protein
MNKYKKAQILVIVLIVMMVLAITVVSVTNNLLRDIQQSKYNTEYESLYAAAEKHVLNLAQSIPLGSDAFIDTARVQAILQDAGFIIEDGDCRTPDDPLEGWIICKVKDPSNPELENANIIVKIEESTNIENVELSKDEIIVFKMSSVDNEYVGNTFTISLTGEGISDPSLAYAVEMAFDFRYTIDGVTQYLTIREVFQPSTKLFESYDATLLYPEQIINQSNGTFEYDSLKNKAVESMIRENYIENTDPSASITIDPLALRFKLLINTPADQDSYNAPSVFISVLASGDHTIIQTRKFQATAYNTLEDDILFGPQALVEANVPMYKIPAILDYILRSTQDINVEDNT